MIEYLQELLKEISSAQNDLMPTVFIKNIKQKKIALETAIEILEKVKNNERNVLNGNIK